MRRESTRYDGTLEARTYEYAIRSALRKCGLYLRTRSGEKVIGLRLPAGSELDVYREATRALLRSTEMLQYYHTASVAIGRRGETLSEDARDAVRMKAAVVVLIEHGATMPFEFELAFDRIVDVDPLRPGHIMSAAKEAWKMAISREQAIALVKFPSPLLFAALRNGRPIDVVIAKLAAASSPARTAKWEPLLEELEGYGEAKMWGLSLVTDMSDWRSGKIAWRDVDCGLLLSGPPGTGKTLFASALARSCGAHFIGTSSAQWQAKGHLGDMLGAMRKSFRDASEHAPTVLFIDEVDAIGDRKSFGADHANYSTQVVNALLELLDGSNGREGVVVVAASNWPEQLDPALRRAGRLDRHMVIGLPDQAARAQMLAVHLDRETVQIDDLQGVAKAMGGYSGALIAQLAKDARRIARKQGRDVTVDDVMTLVPPLAAIDHEEKWETCVHEAGHAIVGLELGFGDLEFIAVAREVGHRDGKAGHVQWKRKLRRNRKRQSYLDEIAMSLSGMAAESVVLGDVLDGSGGVEGSDLQRASDMATLMVANLGIASLHYSDISTPKELDELRRQDPAIRERVEDILEQQLDRAREVIRMRVNDVETLARLLMERDFVPGQEVLRLIERPRGDQTAA